MGTMAKKTSHTFGRPAVIHVHNMVYDAMNAVDSPGRVVSCEIGVGRLGDVGRIRVVVRRANFGGVGGAALPSLGGPEGRPLQDPGETGGQAG